MEVNIMATTIMLLIVLLSAIAIVPLLDTRNALQVHHTDLMAGDEGED
jgi:hypothetical protein